MGMRLSLCKTYIGGSYEAVVFDLDSRQIVWRSGTGWNKTGRERCARYIRRRDGDVSRLARNAQGAHVDAVHRG